MDKKFYITTAIAYTSAKPHLGNTYEIVLTDAIARYKRLQGYKVYFQTGSDEHGEKIEIKAKENNFEPKEYTDSISKEIKNIWDIMNTSYDKFVRTTDPKHVKKVQEIFQKFYDQGNIYKGEYKGLYCTPCESFWTSSQLIDGKCPDCGRDVQEKVEEAYFFKMSKYADWLINYIETHPNFIEPESRKNEIVNNFLRPGLQDLCVSRTSFKWGIPVTFDSKHVVYVWIDALSNYITFIGYNPSGNSDSQFNELWPADLQIIGKDILRFHTIYWPIMLHALGLELPKKIFGHPWLLFANDKMSKSKGNIVYADDLVAKYGVDAIRYYLLHEIPFASDGNFTIQLLENAYNSDLANTLGNLVNRSLNMVNKYFEGIVENKLVTTEIDNGLINLVNNTQSKVTNNIENVRISDALDNIFEIYRACNKYIDETSPWLVAKDESQKARLETILYNLLESIRCATVLLQAFLPDTAKEIFKELNTVNTSFDTIENFGYQKVYQIGKTKIIFQRIVNE